jgi:hypothetical protein
MQESPASDFPLPKKAGERVLTVPERIVVFVDRLRRTEPKAVFATSMAEIRDLKAHYALRYVRVALSRYRVAVSAAFGDEHPALKYLHSFRRDIADYNAVDRRNVFDRHLALRPVDPDEFVERALGQLESPNYGRLVAAVLLLTGRRTVEICFSGEFALVPERDDVLLFAGQAKGKGTDKPPYEIPVLADPRDILAAIEVVRARFAFASNADVNSKKAKEIGDAARQVFGGDYNPQELRKVYAAIAYHDYDQSEPSPRLSEPAYLAAILGHGDGDVQTALSYMAYFVQGDFDRWLRNFQDGMRDMIPILNERHRNAEPKSRPFIEADLARVQDLAGDVASPVATPEDQREIERLSPRQRDLLTAVLTGKKTFAGTERWTVEALVRRRLVKVTIDNEQRFAEPQISLTSHGAELGALIRSNLFERDRR